MRKLLILFLMGFPMAVSAFYIDQSITGKAQNCYERKACEGLLLRRS